MVMCLPMQAIADATNAKHEVDDTFAFIENVDVIEVGWKLCAPSAADAEAMLNQPLAAPDTEAMAGGMVIRGTGWPVTVSHNDKYR
jgi:hypothetical protein